LHRKPVIMELVVLFGGIRIPPVDFKECPFNSDA